VLDCKWQYEEAGKKLLLTVKQVQQGSLFSFPLEIGVFSGENEVPGIQTLYINKELEEVAIPLASKPAKIVLDPNINLLFEGSLKN
jgi:hypothetical protein